MKISVVIVSYNVKYLLEQCLLSVGRAVAGMEAEVFVVDNNSADGSVEYLRPKFPEVVFIGNTSNPGFAAANNQAIRQCRGEYVLLLNPDTIIGEGCIRTLCFFMDEHAGAGGAGVKMIDAHGAFLPESKRSFPSPWVSFCKLSGLSRLFPASRWLARYSLSYLSPDKEHTVDVLSGAFMMLRREALDKAGLPDEAFFMYGEDIDLSYRMVLNGYSNYYIPERILHYKGESTRRGDMSFVKNFYGAMLIFYRKYYPASGRAASLLIRLAVGMKASAAAFSRIMAPRKPPARKIKRRRLLVICHEENFETIKAASVRRMPELEFVNLWDLDTNRVMDAICRRNQMKAFTDIAFCCQDMRFEQMLLFMDTLESKKTTYHIYNKESGRLVSPKNL
ncbi:MAG: glycosyltransferase family 2 protein [Tannerellaceae bacterium]|jgi:GT2 family glycosyltransferase|nr:glycosyltransferase family 2 protein [Tannerellaceae bacterium]